MSTNPLRTTTSGTLLVLRRRMRAERGLLLGSLLLVAVTCFVALSGPRMLTAAVDAGARDAVTQVGSDADLVVELPTTVTTVGIRHQSDAASLLRGAAEQMHHALPAEIAPVVRAPTTAVVAETHLLLDDVAVISRFAWWSTQETTGMTWVDGAAPGASTVVDEPTGHPDDEVQTQVVEAAVSRQVADDLGLHVGDRLAVRGSATVPAEILLAGIFEPVDPADLVWTTATGLLATTTSVGATTRPVAGFFLTDGSLPDMMSVAGQNSQRAWVRFPVVAQPLTGAAVPALGRALARLAADPTPLQTSYGVPSVRTGLVDVLADYSVRLRGVNAQAYLVLAGLVAVGALSLVLAARLVVERRSRLIATERARGASVAWVAATLAAEQAPLAALGFGLGALGATLVAPGTAWVWWPAVVVAGTASIAVPVGGALLAARSWTGRQLPANRRDRERLMAHRRTRRLVVEAAVVVLAAGATVAVRGRGLLQSQTQDVDLLLSVTPALLAAAATVVMVRVLPPVMRQVGALAARSRGIVPVVATARAALSSGTGLPLLALAISLALVIFTGSITASVTSGQERASSQRVEADVRINGPLPDGLAAQLRSSPGVDTVATAYRARGRSFNLSTGQKVTVLAAESAALDRILTRHDERYVGELLELPGDGEGGAPRALVSPGLLDAVRDIGSTVYGGKGFVELDVIGTTALADADDELVVVDLDAFLAADTDGIVPEVMWVDGPGAAAAVEAADLDLVDGLTVTVREQWLSHARTSPLTVGVLDLLRLAAIALAAYASVALALTVVATAPERGRTLSALRTLGLDGRLARRITVGELLPLAVAALVVGGAIGIGLPGALGAALGLRELTGELRPAPVHFSGVSVAVAAAATVVALAVSVVVEGAVRRRDRLGDVLRVGER